MALRLGAEAVPSCRIRKFKLDKLPLYFDDEKYPFTDEDQVLQ